MNNDVPSLLTNLGLPGLVISAMAFVIRRQYSDNQALQVKYDKLQEDRLLDVKETIDKVATPLAVMANVMPLINDKLKSSKKL